VRSSSRGAESDKNTTQSAHELARRVRELVATESDLALRVTVMSFGFKYGLPMDADQVLDVRFIPNPYWVTELRHLTGKDTPVADYVFAQDGAAAFVDAYADLLAPALEMYKQANPWIAEHELRPKSVVRDMVENAMTFSDLISRYELGRSEGVVLRYLTDAFAHLEPATTTRSYNEEWRDYWNRGGPPR